MKKLIIIGIVLLVLVLAVFAGVFLFIVPVDYEIRSNEIDFDIKDYIISETPVVRDYNGHSKVSRYTLDEEDVREVEWNYNVNGMGLNYVTDDGKELFAEVRAIQKNLNYNEYYCHENEEQEIVIFPGLIVIEGDLLKDYAKEFNFDKIRVKGYKLVAIQGNYRYLEGEIDFTPGETNKLDIDKKRFFPFGISLMNDEGHYINVYADKHDDHSCHVFYHYDTSNYQILKTDYLDWWIFENEHGRNLVSFQGDKKRRYDLYISEGEKTTVEYEGEEYEGYASKWKDKLENYKIVLDQLGDLSQLNTMHVGFKGSSNQGSSKIEIFQYEF